jgi:hypothetical protein
MLFSIKIASLGRQQIKIATTYGKNHTGPVLALDLDSPNTVSETFEGLEVLVTSFVDKQRITRMLLVLRSLKEGLDFNNVCLQIKTLGEMGKTLHLGDSMLGYGVYPMSDMFVESACLETRLMQLLGQNRIIQFLLKPTAFYLCRIEVDSKSLTYLFVDNRYTDTLDYERKHTESDIYLTDQTIRIIPFQAPSPGDCCITDILCTQVCFKRDGSQLLLVLSGKLFSLCNIPQDTDDIYVRFFSSLEKIVNQVSLLDKQYTCLPGVS